MNVLKSVFTAAIISTAVFSASVMAELSDKPVGSGPNPFVDCGVGASLFPDTHWAAVTSNIIWDAGTTALTSATASPETCQGAKVQAAMFIKDTYPNVIEETAAGHGEHLSAMLQILGCSADQHVSIIESVRTEIGVKISTEGYGSKAQLEKSADYYDIINNTIETEYADSCSA